MKDKKFAGVVCWCEHDCCEGMPRKDRKEYKILQMKPPEYQCEHCECHWPNSSWDDMADW